ncbi:MAG TPA: hypothetical protein VK277_00115 [Acidimicrobiales bacterium]|nr:hypothetical protein [Acidimicrobiales bacterium]
MTTIDEITASGDGLLHDGTAPKPRRHPVFKRIAAVVALGMAGALAAGCSSGGGTAGSTGGGSVVTTTVPPTTSTTTTTLPAGVTACGSQRDPFDPALTPPPAGSPANC